MYHVHYWIMVGSELAGPFVAEYPDQSIAATFESLEAAGVFIAEEWMMFDEAVRVCIVKM